MRTLGWRVAWGICKSKLSNSMIKKFALNNQSVFIFISVIAFMLNLILFQFYHHVCAKIFLYISSFFHIKRLSMNLYFQTITLKNAHSPFVGRGPPRSLFMHTSYNSIFLGWASNMHFMLLPYLGFLCHKYCIFIEEISVLWRLQ